MIVIALLTFGCFIFANIASTLMVQAEARNRAFMAGIFEATYALFWIYAAKYALDTSPIEITALIAGNFLGAVIGTKVGEKWVTNHEEVELKERLHEAEAAVALAHDALEELEDEIEHHHENKGDLNL